jgi:hypothetical protein
VSATDIRTVDVVSGLRDGKVAAVFECAQRRLDPDVRSDGPAVGGRAITGTATFS